MSVTTTQNPTTYTLAQTLAEYELHHSEGPEDSEQQTAPPNPRESAPSTENNPAGWEAEYRRVPPHRPTDTTLDFASRDITNNGIERFFITNMFQGIWIVSQINHAWRATGGKINDTYFRYPIGGQY